MQLQTGFSLGLPLEQAWSLLTDLERVAPSMPGVGVDSADADGVQATMRVKVGPVTAAYRTQVTMESEDAASRTAVLKASGRETRGPGTVEATVTAKLRPESDDRTAVELMTDLAVTGKIAQFGSGVMKEVADRLLAQFAENLDSDLAGPTATEQPGPQGVATADAHASPGPVAVADPQPVDLGAAAARAMAPRLAAAGLVALLALVLLRRGRR